MDQFQSPGFVTWIVNLTLKLVTLCIGIVTAQDDFGGDDAGADMDLESMMGGDSGAPADKDVEVEVEPKSFTEESILALQQLGLIIGVAFMVGFLFMVMVGIEKVWDKLGAKYQEVTGKKQMDPFEKDPASLVGTFSRYK